MSDLDRKLDNLTLTETKPKSLLSSSLAGERSKGSFYLEENSNNNSNSNLDPLRNGNNIDSNNFTDDHPEPELLASSVGKEMDGRMIPSSSTISLLSLSVHPEATKVTTGFNPLPQQPPHQHQTQFPTHHIHPPQGQVSQFGFSALDRKNSFNNISSRNSLTHLYQKRGVVAPLTPTNTQSPTNNLPSMFSSTSTTQSIPINNRIPVSIPDSPNLDPTSLGGSPSRFWLSSQTPPRSLGNSLNSSSRQLYYMLQHSQQQNQNIVVAPPQDRSNYIASSAHTTTGPIAINRKRSDDSSPVLIPVLTPTEEPPMTPLYLNGQQYNQEYFEVREDVDENMEL